MEYVCSLCLRFHMFTGSWWRRKWISVCPVNQPLSIDFLPSESREGHFRIKILHWISFSLDKTVCSLCLCCFRMVGSLWRRKWTSTCLSVSLSASIDRFLGIWVTRNKISQWEFYIELASVLFLFWTKKNTGTRIFKWSIFQEVYHFHDSNSFSTSLLVKN